jgi:hypothetical protein
MIRLLWQLVVLRPSVCVPATDHLSFSSHCRDPDSCPGQPKLYLRWIRRYRFAQNISGWLDKELITEKYIVQTTNRISLPTYVPTHPTSVTHQINTCSLETGSEHHLIVGLVKKKISNI